MRATVCGHHVRQRNDEKLADLRSETLIMWHKSPSPPRSVFISRGKRCALRGHSAVHTIGIAAHTHRT